MASNNNNNPPTPHSAVTGPQNVTPPQAPLAPTLNQPATFGMMALPPRNNLIPTSHDLSDDEEDDEGSDDDNLYSSDRSSAMHLNITTTTHIKGDNNHMTIDPSSSANQIATHLSAALAKLAQGGGIPMIGENGRPRHLRINIKAGCNITGQHNTVGNKEAVSTTGASLKPVADIGMGMKRKIFEQVKAQKLVEAKELKDRKRERAGSEGLENGFEVKRVKKE